MLYNFRADARVTEKVLKAKALAQSDFDGVESCLGVSNVEFLLNFCSLFFSVSCDHLPARVYLCPLSL